MVDTYRLAPVTCMVVILTSDVSIMTLANLLSQNCDSIVFICILADMKPLTSTSPINLNSTWKSTRSWIVETYLKPHGSYVSKAERFKHTGQRNKTCVHAVGWRGKSWPFLNFQRDLAFSRAISTLNISPVVFSACDHVYREANSLKIPLKLWFPLVSHINAAT